MLAGWRGLGRFWVAVLLLAGGTGLVLQVVGPPPVPKAPSQAGPVTPAIPFPAKSPPVLVSQTEQQPALRPGRTIPGPVADPDPSLMEPYPDDAKLHLPRISPDGRAPMEAYAAGFDPSNLRPRVGLLVAGIGMNAADSLIAIKTLPGGISLAVSPTAGDLTTLLAVARLNEHEYLLSLPMEPQGFPLNDPDNRMALMTSLSPADNMQRLHAMLARLTGYVGVTNAFGPMRGERLSGMAPQFDPVLEDVAHRGLLFADARTGQRPLPYVWSRSADIVLDDGVFDAAVLDRRLEALTHLALDKGSALGLVMRPRPVTLDRIAAWTNTLAANGVALAPISALMGAAPKQDPEK
jgi:polysaccharide deacetylase 2 family uncharacterized protein YibQ